MLPLIFRYDLKYLVCVTLKELISFHHTIYIDCTYLRQVAIVVSLHFQVEHFVLNHSNFVSVFVSNYKT